MKYSEYIQAINREFKTKDNVIASMNILPPRSVKDFPLVNFRKLWHLGKTPHEAMELAISIYLFIKPQYIEQSEII